MGNHEHGHAIVVLGGGPLLPSLRGMLPPGALIVAADSGADHALAAGLVPTVVVGDFDSISEGTERILTDAGVDFDRFPVDKDSTDGQLAIGAAMRRGATHVTLVSGGSIERLDHLLAVIGLLANPLTDGIVIDAFLGHAGVQRARVDQPVSIGEPAGYTVTLLPLFTTVTGVRTIGLHWPLDFATLPAGSTRGVSNLVAESPASVSVASGTLLVITPEALA
jgi:thiamine pyrophosphokinase